MLANLSLVHCYDLDALPRKSRDEIMLQSAKDNLRELTFFGITEYQRESQLLFETTFNMKFKTDFVQFDSGYAAHYDISDTQRQLVLARNELDMQLYDFAKELFFSRYRSITS